MFLNECMNVVSDNYKLNVFDCMFIIIKLLTGKLWIILIEEDVLNDSIHRHWESHFVYFCVALDINFTFSPPLIFNPNYRCVKQHLQLNRTPYVSAPPTVPNLGSASRRRVFRQATTNPSWTGGSPTTRPTTKRRRSTAIRSPSLAAAELSTLLKVRRRSGRWQI